VAGARSTSPRPSSASCASWPSPGRVFSREVLLEQGLGLRLLRRRSPRRRARPPSAHQGRVRPANPRHVVTVRGLGYKLQACSRDQGVRPRLPVGVGACTLLGSRRLGLRARITSVRHRRSCCSATLLSATYRALTRENLLASARPAVDQVVYQNGRTGSGDQLRPRTRLRPSSSTSLATPRGPDRCSSTRAASSPLRPPSSGGRPSRPSFRDTSSTGSPARMRYVSTGEMQLAIGVPLPAVDAAYFEIMSLEPTSAHAATPSGSRCSARRWSRPSAGRLGWWVSRRCSCDRSPSSARRRRDRGGRLDTRLEASDDPTWRPSPPRSTTWPRPSRSASSATPASPPTSATSCAPP
jgi:hypothetical protein